MSGWGSPSWLVEALVASTVLMVLVLLLRRPVRKAFGADVAYALWLLPVLRLALPPLPAAWHAAAVAPVLRATEQMTVLLVEPAGLPTATAAPAFAWVIPAIAVAWLLGAGVFLAWHALAHLRFCRRLLDHSASRVEQDGVLVIETSAATGPLAFGIWRRYVAFPRDFAERYEPEERDLALAHELGHHARGDLIANWIALVVLALHWFNPIAWRAFRAFRADQEIANDARVLAGMNPMRRHTYACAILKAAHPTLLGGTVSATCHLHTIDDLKGRLRMLTTTRTSRARLVAGAGVLSLCVAGGLGLTASGTAAAAKVRSTVEHATGVDLASLDQAAQAPADAAVTADAPAASHAAVAAAPAQPSQVLERVVASDMAGPGSPSSPEPQLPPSGMPAASPASPQGPGDAQSTVTVSVDKGGKRIVRSGRYVKLNRDGSSTLVGEIAPIPPMPRMESMPTMASIRPIPPILPTPHIVSKTCGTRGKVETMVITDRRAGGQRIIVCTDRIAAVAAKGAEIAVNSKDMQRSAYANALDGLRASRARMIAGDDMTDTERHAALAGIDTAIAELEADLAKAR